MPQRQPVLAAGGQGAAGKGASSGADVPVTSGDGGSSKLYPVLVRGLGQLSEDEVREVFAGPSDVSCGAPCLCGAFAAGWPAPLASGV